MSNSSIALYKNQLDIDNLRASNPTAQRPCNHDIEARLLGALMLERDVITELVDKIHVELFDQEGHRCIFKAIRTLFNGDKAVDMFTVMNQLKKDGKFEIAGGGKKITELTYLINSTDNAETHFFILQELFIKRSILNLAGELTIQAQKYNRDAFELLDTAQQELFDLAEMNINKQATKMSESMRTVLDELQEIHKSPENVIGIPSGFQNLDRTTTGWHKTDLVIIAARPGMGKTAFILSAVRNAAVTFKKPVAIFSLEMSTSQLVKRMLSSECEINGKKFRDARFSEQEWNALFTESEQLREAPIFIDDTPGLPVLELRAKCRRLKSQHNIELVIIDYLQMMHDSTKQKSGNREQEVAQISRSLKEMAKELDVAVIALAQLNRSVEARGGTKRPMLSDLRESGSIEQDADMVMFIYRPEYYGLTEDENGESTKELAELVISKNRHGGLDTVKLRFINEITKFCEFDPSEIHNLPPQPNSDYQLPPPNHDVITKNSSMNDEDDDHVPF